MEEYLGLGVYVTQCTNGGALLGKERSPGGGRLGNSVGLEPLGATRLLHHPKPTIYPMGQHVSLEAAPFVVSDAPGHHDLRACVVLFMAVLSDCGYPKCPWGIANPHPPAGGWLSDYRNPAGVRVAASELIGHPGHPMGNPLTKWHVGIHILEKES